MEHKNLINKFNKKVKIEAIIKSTILGLITGFSSIILLKIVSFIAKFDATLVALYIGLGVILISTITFYFVLYRPNHKKVAGRIDGLGLDERVITMLELDEKGMDNFIAHKQRKNTIEKLLTVNTKQLRLNLSTIPLVIMLALIPVTAGTMVINSVQDSQQIDDNHEEDELIDEKIAELREIVRKADITNDQRFELNSMIDDLVIRIESYNTFDEKMNDIIQTKAELLDKLEDFIISNLLDVLHEIIDEAEVSDEFKDTLHLSVDDFKNSLANYPTLDEKIDEVKEFVVEILDTIVDEAVVELRDLVAQAEASQEIKDICYGLIDDLEDRIETVHETYEEKMQDIKETKEEILKLLTPPPTGGEEPKPNDSTTTEELEELGNEMQEAIDEAIDQLEDIQNQSGTPTDEELEGELPIEEPSDDEQEGNGEEGEPNDSLPPPPPLDGEVAKDVIIDGITPYLPILEEELPGITEKLADGSLPDDLKSLIEAYLELITKNQSQG